MKKLSVHLLVASFSLIAFACPVVGQEVVASGGRKSVELTEPVPTRFTLDQASYMMAIEGTSNAYVPAANEKMLVLEYTLENISDANRTFPINGLHITAVDRDDRFGEETFSDATDRRLWGTEDPINEALLPGQSRRIYQGIFVNGDSTIDSLLVSFSGQEVFTIPVTGSIAPLPAELAGASGELPEIIPADFTQRYVLGPYDMTVEGIDRGAIPEDEKEDRILVPVALHNRLDEDLRVRKEMIPAYLMDADGERHITQDLWKASSDATASLVLSPGQIVTVRLNFEVPKVFRPSELAIYTKGRRGEGHRLLFNLGGDTPYTGEFGTVLGKYEPTPGGGSGAAPSSGRTESSLDLADVPSRTVSPDGTTRGSSIPSPPERTVATGGSTATGTSPSGGITSSGAGSGTGVRPIGTVSGPPEVDIGEIMEREREAFFGAETGSSEGTGRGAFGKITTVPEQDLEATLARHREEVFGSASSRAESPPEEPVKEEPQPPTQHPATVRDAVIELHTFEVQDQHENAGDEYYIVTFPFRGVLGAGDRIYTFDAAKQIRGIVPGENWAKINQTFNIPADVGKLEFQNLQPFEVYGVVGVVMESDGNTGEEREYAFGWGEFQNEDGVLEVLADLFNRAIPRDANRPDYNDRTCENIVAIDEVNRYSLAMTFGEWNYRGDTANAIRAAISEPLKRSNPDDFDGWFWGFYMNAPGGEACFPNGHQGGRKAFPPPGPLMFRTESTRIIGEHRQFE